MATHFDDSIRAELLSRRQRLETAASSSPGQSYLSSLLREVDSALSRLDDGTFGLCDTCHDPIEAERLAADPLVRFCLDHLTVPEQRALEQDLDLAANIQAALLPKNGLVQGSWETAYHFQAAGPVSGDYCDLIPAADGSLYFMVGDVSGKGVAASMLMSNLHAMFRALTGTGLPLIQVIQRASRLFCESTLANHYATLVCGRAEKNGHVEICNAGHLAPLLGQGGIVRTIDSTGLPLGMFCSEDFELKTVRLRKGDCLLLYTDGLTEAQDPAGTELGIEPLIEIVRNRQPSSVQDLVRTCVAKASSFRSGLPLKDDLTVMALERVD